MQSIAADIEQIAETFPRITLDEMKDIRLMNRTDCKYVTNIGTLLRLLERAKGYYYSQEVEGCRVSPYATTYWDTPTDQMRQSMFRCHETGHTPRQKVRVRTYVSSDLSFLEVKKKDNHGKTRKLRTRVPSLQAVMNGEAGGDFLFEETGMRLNELAPAVGNRFDRLTLVNLDKTERLTIDFDLEFYNYTTKERAEMDNIVVIELKRDGRCASPILPLLRELRIKPSGFSKYCIGASVTNSSLRINRFKKRLVKIRKIRERGAAASV